VNNPNSIKKQYIILFLPNNQKQNKTKQQHSYRNNMASTSDYWVGEVIGEGSFGTVLYGRHKSTQLDVAIKCVEKVSLMKDRTKAMIILSEQQILKQINQHSKNEYVTRLYASFHDTECVYLVIECCAGGTLQDVIIRQKRQQQTGCTTEQKKEEDEYFYYSYYYAQQILGAMSYLHRVHEIIHGDLKPENILITQQGRIKLADFGSAVKYTTSSSATVTACWIPRGTAAYCAPELFAAPASTSSTTTTTTTIPFSITPAVDLWSYGCILYALQTGQSPFHAESEALILDQIREYVQSRKEQTEEDHKKVQGSGGGSGDDDNIHKHPTGRINSSTIFHASSWCHHTYTDIEQHHLQQDVILDLLHPDPMQRIQWATTTTTVTTNNNINHNSSLSTSMIPSVEYASFHEESKSDSSCEQNEKEHVVNLYPRLVHALTSGRRSCSSSNDASSSSSSLRKDWDSHPPRYIPDPPAWWKQRDQIPLKDGALGWSAFLV
jgi:3-phosphoinositide dependent protein kinase-1